MQDSSRCCAHVCGHAEGNVGRPLDLELESIRENVVIRQHELFVVRQAAISYQLTPAKQYRVLATAVALPASAP